MKKIIISLLTISILILTACGKNSVKISAEEVQTEQSEEETISEETERNVIREGTYELNNGDMLTIKFTNGDGGERFEYTIYTVSKENAILENYYFINALKSVDIDGNLCIIPTGDLKLSETTFKRNGSFNSFYFNEDGSPTLTTPYWLEEDEIVEAFLNASDYNENLTDEINDCMKDFGNKKY